ncbi:MAG: hypothetical protein PHX34_03585 [Candidatus Shapirobacteria bacterium]|nr:hypothetical protein [Candidatus Shapirobacteria bacterium]
MSNYNFFLIFFLTFLAYFFSLYLVKTKKINLITHRQFWNIILLISFLFSGVIGLILAFSIDQKLSINWYLPFLWLHVEFGIIMALVSLFHIFYHFSYFLNVFKNISFKKN